VKIDPTNGQITEILVGGEGIVESVQNRLLNASGKHYAYHFQMQDGVRVRWRELADGGAEGEFILKPPGKEGDEGGLHFAFERAMLSMNGAILALPALGGVNERVELFNTGAGSFAAFSDCPRDEMRRGSVFANISRDWQRLLPMGWNFGARSFNERRTGYRWSSDMAAPILLSWDELEELWGEGK
jgi:hypothetical protein